jgi:uncharacterized membrane protein YeiH
VVPGLDPTLLLWINLVGTFVFGLSGGAAAVRARLDLFGVVVLAAVVGLTGGIVRDLLIGVPPSTFRESSYLAVVGAAGLVSYFAAPTLARVHREVQFFDAVGLSVFCVTGASKAVSAGLGPTQAIILGAVTGIGGGMTRDILLRQVPTVLRHELYAIPALVGAGIAVAAQEAGSTSPVFAFLAAGACFAIRMVGLRFGVNVPIAPAERRGRQEDA